MSKSQENYNKKRVQIVSAASGLFLSLGFERTNMDAVAERAEVTKQTVYRYFPSKIDLFSAVIGSISDGDIDHEFGRRGVLEELIRFGENFISVHMDRDRLSLYRIMMAESGEGNQLSQVFKDKAQSVRKAPFIAFLKDRVNLSEPEDSADIFCSMLLCFRNQIILGNKEIPDDYNIRKHAEFCAEIFINGVIGL